MAPAEKYAITYGEATASRRLTVELSGRREVPRALQSVFAHRARQAPSVTTVHGPFQRLLEDALIGATVRVRLRCGKPRRHSLRLSASLRWERRRSALSRAAPKRRWCMASPRWRAPRHQTTLL